MGSANLPGSEWLASPLGARCLATEQRLVRRALERRFGEQLLQIGIWGHRRSFISSARTHHAATLDWRVGLHPDICSHTDQLAVATDSVDVVLLPHTLELITSPHSLLREVDRVLRPDGYLIILSFSPSGAWGLRHLLSRDGYPPGHERLIRERRLRDWLELLSFEVGAREHYCHALPIERFAGLGKRSNENWVGRFLPGFSAGYLLSAQKRVHPLTPIRPTWSRRHLKVVGGLVEPTTRVSQRRGL
ncbi:MAG TPA: methyltransferase domain-containing protein [Gammaproteobacteria bacterium]